MFSQGEWEAIRRGQLGEYERSHWLEGTAGMTGGRSAVCGRCQRLRHAECRAPGASLPWSQRAEERLGGQTCRDQGPKGICGETRRPRSPSPLTFSQSQSQALDPPLHPHS